MTKKQEPGYQPTAADDAAFRRRRTHAHIEAMTGLILQAVGFPSRRHRDFISALQSVNTGEDARVPYTKFRRAHLTIAAHMQLEGSSDTKRKAVYRETVVLRAFTKRTGILLFHVTPGKEDEATTYIDYLTPAADAAAQMALSSDLWRTDKQKAKQEAVAWAVAQLPRVDPEADDPEGAPPQAVDAYEAAQDARLLRSAETVADEVAKRGGDDDLFLERHIRALVKMRASRKKTAPARNDRGSLNRLLEDEREAAAAGADEAEVSGDTTWDNSVRTPPASSKTEDAAEVRTKVSVPPAEKEPDSAEKEPDLSAAALSYARRGWHVFPLHSPDPDRGCTCAMGKACTSPGKHPRTRKGLKDATTDERQIKAWWQKWPLANVGLTTGKASGLVAVDVDHRGGGGASLTELFEAHGQFPETLEAETGGGFHIFFSHPGVSFKNSSSVLGEGLDVKTDGGYVVAAPSLHASGKRYRWTSKKQPARMPQWLLTLLTTERPKPTEAQGAKARPRTSAGEGPQIRKDYRNTTLFRIACAMRGAGSDKEDIAAELHTVNASRCVPPLDDAEVEKIAASATRYQRGSGRARAHAKGVAP
ncbi:MAG TPA: bifunctional DNA primase/polymerase [Pyrinomonadaceae bacterium]